MGFQRFPKFPQPLRVRFKFFLKKHLIRFSRWKKWLAASLALLRIDPACEKVTKLRRIKKPMMLNCGYNQIGYNFVSKTVNTIKIIPANGG